MKYLITTLVVLGALGYGIKKTMETFIVPISLTVVMLGLYHIIQLPGLGS